MSIWKLIPVDPSDPSWQASSYRGTVVVRATNESIARQTAARAFDIAIGFPLRAGVRAPPWLRPALVRAEKLDSTRYAAEGAPEVLEPKL